MHLANAYVKRQMLLACLQHKGSACEPLSTDCKPGCAKRPVACRDCRDAFEFAYAMRELPAEEADARSLPQPRFQSWFGRLPAIPAQAKIGLPEADLGALQVCL